MSSKQDSLAGKRKYATSLGKLTKKQIDALLLKGQMMSNWFFNCKQSDKFAAEYRAQFAEMQQEWDEIRHNGVRV